MSKRRAESKKVFKVLSLGWALSSGLLGCGVVQDPVREEQELTSGELSALEGSWIAEGRDQSESRVQILWTQKRSLIREGKRWMPESGVECRYREVASTFKVRRAGTGDPAGAAYVIDASFGWARGLPEIGEPSACRQAYWSSRSPDVKIALDFTGGRAASFDGLRYEKIAADTTFGCDLRSGTYASSIDVLIDQYWVWDVRSCMIFEVTRVSSHGKTSEVQTYIADGAPRSLQYLPEGRLAEPEDYYIAKVEEGKLRVKIIQTSGVGKLVRATIERYSTSDLGHLHSTMSGTDFDGGKIEERENTRYAQEPRS